MDHFVLAGSRHFLTSGHEGHVPIAGDFGQELMLLAWLGLFLRMQVGEEERADEKER